MSRLMSMGRRSIMPLPSAATRRLSRSFGYVGVQLNAAAYREGDITLEGKKHHVVLFDLIATDGSTTPPASVPTFARRTGGSTPTMATYCWWIRN